MKVKLKGSGKYYFSLVGVILSKPMVKIGTINTLMYSLVFHGSDSTGLGSKSLFANCSHVRG